MIRYSKIRCAVLIIFAAVLPSSCTSAKTVTTGLDNIHSYHTLFAHKRLGIVTNHTACDARGRHIVDIITAMPDVKVTALFGPEHGITGLAAAGAHVADRNDLRLGIPVYSLYGDTSKPTPEMLADVDVLVFDIQDVGARFYTYLYTMAYAMEAAAENNIPFVLLDRPNPINGTSIEGGILEKRFASFVGLYPIPVRYGMTIGELAAMFNEEGWLKNKVKARLTVVPVRNWRRTLWYDQTGLKFIKPSPNIPDLTTAAVYPGLCLLEGTNVSEGRGTDKPFLQFGAPWVDSDKLTARLNSLNITGLRFIPASFTPQSSKHENTLCRGTEIVLTDRNALQPFFAGIRLIDTLYRMYPNDFQWYPSHFDRLCGTASVRNTIIDGKSLDDLKPQWLDGLDSFMKVRRKYLVYPD
jgi:uncharacterized protein YbbC (DUF1343 family)